jgi:hypothetical protein
MSDLVTNSAEQAAKEKEFFEQLSDWQFFKNPSSRNSVSCAGFM